MSNFYQNPQQYQNGFQTASYGAFGNPGYNYNYNQPVQKLTNTLSPEEVASLRDKGEPFSLKLTPEEKLRAVCNHINPETGMSALLDNPDGSVTCTICHHKFSTEDVSVSEVQESTDMILNFLQTSKLLYLDMPAATAREYYQIIPLIEKLPKLFKIASDNFRRHENIPGFMPGQSQSPFTIFGALNNPATYYQQQPVYGYQQQNAPYQDMYAQQAPAQQMGQAPQPQPGNPFYGYTQQPAYAQQPQAQQMGMGQPSYGQVVPQPYAPQPQDFQYTPQTDPRAPQPQQVQQVQPAAPNTQGEVNVSKSFTA